MPKLKGHFQDSCRLHMEVVLLKENPTLCNASINRCLNCELFGVYLTLPKWGEIISTEGAFIAPSWRAGKLIDCLIGERSR